MNKKIKMLTVLLSVIFCISFCFLAVSADETSSDVVADVTVEVPTQAIPTEPQPEPTTAAPVETQPPTYEPKPEPTTAYVEYTEPPTQDNYWSGDVDTNDNNDDDQLTYSDDDNYVGGGQTYVPPVNTAPPAALYEPDSNIDDKELSKSDWNDIAANLKGAGSGDAGADGDDFNFIKNNNSTGDNGDWMLIVGILCLLLSAAGIAYAITSHVMCKKKLNSTSRHSSSKQYAYASSGRASNDYGDGYRQSSQREKKQAQRRSKYDTADINLPRRGSHGNGRRYK